MTDVVAHFRGHLDRVGLDLLGTTSVAAYDADVPPARRLTVLAPGAVGVLVVGNGGPEFWNAFRAAGPPVGRDPLDDFTRRAVGAAAAGVAGARCVFPFEWPAVAVDFRRLGRLAGLGAPSLLGVLIHPVHGPSMALRAAVLLPHALAPVPGPAAGFDPCPSCVERPCVAACPAGVVGDGGWDAAGCAAHRLADAAHCADACAARLACVYGPDRHYPPDALAHHQRAARATMAAHPSAARKV